MGTSEGTVRALVAGANGFLGRAVLRAFAKAGHETRGLVRTRSQFPSVEAALATPVVGDVLEPATLVPALTGCDAVVHLAQSQSPDERERRAVRVDGARHLANVAVACGVRRFLVGSGYWVYPDTPGRITEETPVAPRGLSAMNHDAERAVQAAVSGSATQPLFIRPGMVYGNGSWFGEMVREMHRGEYAHVGDGANHLSPIHLDDAADAFVAIAERGIPGSTYLVVDDHPVPTHEFAEFVSTRLGLGPPGRIDLAEAVRVWGEDLAFLNAANRAASNARLRSLNFSLRYPTFRDGVPTVLREMGDVGRPGPHPTGSPTQPS